MQYWEGFSFRDPQSFENIGQTFSCSHTLSRKWHNLPSSLRLLLPSLILSFFLNNNFASISFFCPYSSLLLLFTWYDIHPSIFESDVFRWWEKTAKRESVDWSARACVLSARECASSWVCWPRGSHVLCEHLHRSSSARAELLFPHGCAHHTAIFPSHANNF